MTHNRSVVPVVGRRCFTCLSPFEGVPDQCINVSMKIARVYKCRDPIQDKLNSERGEQNAQDT